MIQKIFNKNNYCRWLVVAIITESIFLAILLLHVLYQQNTLNLAILSTPHNYKTALNDSKDQHPPVRSNEDFQGEKSQFTFSPDKKLISFVQNVFEEYGNDWDRYWALKIFNPNTREEKSLIIDDTRMSSYKWLNNKVIRVFHNAGTGVRAYLNVSINRKLPILTKDHKRKNIWIPDKDYAKESQNTVEAQRIYFNSQQ